VILSLLSREPGKLIVFDLALTAAIIFAMLYRSPRSDLLAGAAAI
jgi:hypothetical protein